jgi:hypothetical protein
MLYERRGIDDSEFVSMAIRRARARVDGAITKFLLERAWLKGGRQVCPVCDNVFTKVTYDWAISYGFGTCIQAQHLGPGVSAEALRIRGQSARAQRRDDWVQHFIRPTNLAQSCGQSGRWREVRLSG